jgi:hypothetical protein
MDADERECPTEVRGVRITSMPMRDGIAFKFTVAKPKQLPGLRSLLREAAAIIEHRTRVAALHPEVMPMSDGEGGVTALDISVKNTPNGAMVTVRPEDRVFVAQMQRNAHEFELFWSSHECVSVSAMARVPSTKNAIARR